MKTFCLSCLSFVILFAFAVPALAEHRIGQISHVKGQEPTLIRGFGIVGGLNGTGDSPREFGPLARAMIRQLENSGMPMENLPPSSPRERTGPDPVREVGTSKNLAFVEVMVTIPATGARSGQVLDVTVVAVNKAASLEHGVLLDTALFAPVPQDPNRTITLGKAWGKITIDNDKGKNVGTVKAGVDGGCRLTSDFFHPFVKENCVTFVISNLYSRFEMAARVANAINSHNLARGAGRKIAKAINQNNVVVEIPVAYLDDPVTFVGLLRNIVIPPDPTLDSLPQIVIHERAGVISGGERVDISPVFLSHQNISIDVQPDPNVPPPQRWVPMNVDGRFGDPPPGVSPKLRALCETLNEVKVPPKDMIAIIKNLHEQGAIQADVVYR